VDDQGLTQILFGKAASGDRAAFDDLAGRYRDRLEARISSQIRSLQGTIDVEDILQETLVAFGSIGGFRWQGEGSFPAWLEGTAKNVVLKAIRRSRRHRTLETPPDLEEPLGINFKDCTGGYDEVGVAGQPWE
jgi:DNA-directed RNA polymerase specialized sigma24 family protein